MRRTAESLGATAVVLGSLAILVTIALRALRNPVLDAFLVGLAVSLVVNDTPGDVLGMGAASRSRLPTHTLARLVKLSPMRRAAVIVALIALLVGVAGCGGGEEVGATPETVEGTLPAATTSEQPTSTLEGDATNGAKIFSSAGCGGCHALEAAGSTGNVGPDLDERSRLRARRRPRHERPRRDAVVRRQPQRAGNRRRRRVRRRVDELTLPDDFHRDVAAVACDLDRTLIWEDGKLKPRTIAALEAARDAGIHVVIATGRMFRSALRTARRRA